MYQNVSSQQFEDMGRDIIERALYVGQKPDEAALKLRRGYSLRKALVQDVVQSAQQHCLTTAQDADSFRELSWKAIGIIDSLEYSLTEHKNFDFSEDAKHEFNWNFWKHDDRPHIRIKAQNFPYMERDTIEGVAMSYLDLPYRAPLLERNIVDVLIALELYAERHDREGRQVANHRLVAAIPAIDERRLVFMPTVRRGDDRVAVLDLANDAQRL